MSTAATVDLEIDQGADYGVQLYWTTMDQTPYTVLAPMRMEIRDDVGNTMYTLATTDGATAGGATILYNSDTGLIQLMISSDATSGFPSGVYQYDLFVTYMDNMDNNATRVHRLIAGNVYVNKRITRSV